MNHHEYIDSLVEVIRKVENQIDVDVIADTIEDSSIVITAGNGGSAATAMHLASDLVKGCSINTICLTDNTSLFTSYANDVSYEHAMAEMYNNIATGIYGTYPVVMFSGSGNSPNLIELAYAVEKRGDPIIAITGYENSRLHNIVSNYKYGISVHLNTNDMQIAEDIGMILTHIIYKTLKSSHS